MRKSVLSKIIEQLNKYPLVVGAIVIYGYYLTVTIDFFKKSSNGQFSLLDFVLQFDSLIWMWLVAYVFVKLQQAKERSTTEEHSKVIAQAKIQKATIASNLLGEITAQLQDTINNPLAIIRTSTSDLRKKFVADSEMVRRLDLIDSSLRRIHDAIKDVTIFQSTQLLEELNEKAT